MSKRPDKPEVRSHGCENCSNPTTPVRKDAAIGKWLCDWCWVDTRVPDGRKGKRS